MTAKIRRIVVKRVYEKPVRGDGNRVLVDRLVAAGIEQRTAEVDIWLRELAPSNELRQWFTREHTHGLTFRKRYLKELATPEAGDALNQLYRLAINVKR